MWYIIGAIVIGIGFLLSCNFKPPENNNIENAVSSSIIISPNDTIKPMYSKKDIERKLRKLSKTPRPEKLAFGAECYEMSVPPETASYNCPECGNKTLYKLEQGYTELVRWGIIACRNEIKDVKGINIKLDESQFCKKCKPDIKEPKLLLLVNINKNKDTTKVWNINYIDIRLIKNFLNDDLKYKGEQDAEAPLVHRIDRIQELLGVKL